MNTTQNQAIMYGIVIAYLAYTMGKNKASATRAAAAEPVADPLAWLGSWAEL